MQGSDYRIVKKIMCFLEGGYFKVKLEKLECVLPVTTKTWKYVTEQQVGSCCPPPPSRQSSGGTLQIVIRFHQFRH